MFLMIFSLYRQGKSFAGLSALVKNQLGQNPLSVHYFVFVNQRKTQMKVLYFEAAGIVYGASGWNKANTVSKPMAAVSVN